MPELSLHDIQNLKSDLKLLEGSFLQGVLVGIGSIVLIFSNNGTIVIQCPFNVSKEAAVDHGDGKNVESSLFLLPLLSEIVSQIVPDKYGSCTLEFNKTKILHITPENTGYESYVLNTKNGVFPVW